MSEQQRRKKRKASKEDERQAAFLCLAHQALVLIPRTFLAASYCIPHSSSSIFAFSCVFISLHLIILLFHSDQYSFIGSSWYLLDYLLLPHGIHSILPIHAAVEVGSAIENLKSSQHDGTLLALVLT